MLDIILNNLEVAIPIIAVGVEWLSRKLPWSLSVLKALDKILDSLPGFGNNEGK